jgi:hypothetical protein
MKSIWCNDGDGIVGKGPVMIEILVIEKQGIAQM